MKLLHITGFTVLLIMALFLACTCSMKGSSQSVSYAPANGPAYHDMANASLAMSRSADAIDEDADTTQAEGISPESRKLTRKAEIRLRVEDPSATEKPLSAILEKYDAWCASAGIYENSRNYSIRVPSGSYDSMLEELAGLGKILRRTENAEDVTLRYYDLESRLATKRELLKTYQGYLEKARNIDEIMTVESRIMDLQRDIDQTGTQFRNLASMIDYSVINVDITGPASASSYSEPTLGERLKELFGSFGSVASSALVVLAGIVIYGIPALLILVLLFWILFGRIGLIKKLWRFAARK